jgi:tRNA threonylcarbamoyladenosine biosynthesis protein TsaB
MARVLALDTTARDGSVALAIDGVVADTARGDASKTHGERLPGELLDLLARHHLTIDDVDLYAVATGPGSFTGLRVGIATIQGLAMATGRRVVPVSAFDALAHVARRTAAADEIIAAVIDAQRGEVFASLYSSSAEPIGEPTVAAPAAVADAWPAERRILAIGNGAARHAGVLRAALGDRLRLADPPAPALAPAIAELAHNRAAHGAVRPHAIAPVYVRRPDAELARDRTRIQTPESRSQKDRG